MRSRVLWTALLLAALFAVLAFTTCADERSAAPERRETSTAATINGGSDAAASTPRARASASGAVSRMPRVRAAPEPVEPVLEERRFHEPVERWETEKRVDLTGDPPDVLVAKWIAMSDSGVEVERRHDGKALWRVYVEPLGIDHSRYHQEVTIRVEDDRVVVESVGAQKILEVRDLATGAQMSREVTDVVR